MNKNNKGFTLIELLVVVAIIGTLAAVGVVAYNGYTSAAKKNAAKAIHANVVKYIGSELAKCNLGTAPTSFMGVKAGAEAESAEEGEGGEGGEGGDASDEAAEVDCDSTATQLVTFLTGEDTSPFQDKNPHSSTGELAVGGSGAGAVVLTASGTTIQIVTNYDKDDSTAKLENDIEVE